MGHNSQKYFSFTLTRIARFVSCSPLDKKSGEPRQDPAGGPIIRALLRGVGFHREGHDFQSLRRPLKYFVIPNRAESPVRAILNLRVPVSEAPPLFFFFLRTGNCLLRLIKKFLQTLSHDSPRETTDAPYHS